MATVQLLGGIAVRFSDGRAPVTKFRTRKAALLLAYLALHQGQAQPRERLIDLFWPEASPESGRSNLSTTLSILRRQLGDLFDADHATVRLRADRARVDALRFEALARRGLSAGLDADERADALRQARDLWATPLPGIYDDWAVEAQNRLDALADRARERWERLDSPASPAPAPPTAADPLPVALSRYIEAPGRRDALRERLSGARLLTLLGPGGAGKTRLALELARDVAPDYARSAFVSLAELPTPALLLPTLRRALTAAPPAGEPLDEAVGLVNAIPGPALVVLDNLEHLLPGDDAAEEEKSRHGVAHTVRRLLEECPRLTVLATSRQPLGVEAERLYPVPLLPRDLAVELFVDRARAVRPDFTRHPGNAAEIEAVCGLLDGLPLALELAAAWVRALSLADLRGRLERELLWLEGRRRDQSPRQMSLEATLRWSWQLLDADERRLLAALSVFRGGARLDAVEAALPGAATLERLGRLVDKSLVGAEPTADGGMRYTLLETIRQFAHRRLDESGERAAVQERHLEHFRARAEAAEPRLVGAEQRAWLAALDAEVDNLRAALEFGATASGRADAGLALAGALWRFWRTRGFLEEGLGWYRRLLDAERAPTPARAAALHGAGALATVQGDYDAATAFDQESLAIRRALGDDHGVAHSLNNLGNTAFARGDYALARRFHEEGVAIKRRLGDRSGIAVSLNNLGNVAQFQGDLATARRHHEESLALKRELGDENGIAASLLNLGNVALLGDDWAGAEASFRESLTLRHRLGDRSGTIIALESLANLAVRRGDAARSATLFGAASRLHEAIGSSLPEMVRGGHQELLARGRALVGEAAFAAAWQAGRALSEGDAVAWALAP